jgi:hypothetical protein
MLKPFHEHDCSNCKYLGSDLISNEPFDYYSCETTIETSLIARYGINGAYLSLPEQHVQITKGYPLSHAKILFLAA